MIPRLSEVASCFTDLRVYARLISSALLLVCTVRSCRACGFHFGDLALPVHYAEH